MRKILKISLFLLITMPSIYSLACNCAPPRNSDEAFRKAQSVFLGEAVGGTKQPDGQDFLYVHFAVERSWKTIKGIRAQVKVGIPRSCGYQFTFGKKYLVYASDTPPAFTSSCGGTKSLETASKEIKILGASIPLK